MKLRTRIGERTALIPRSESLVVNSSLVKDVLEERPQSRKPVARIDVVLDNIKRKVVRPGEAPDGNRQQHSDLDRWILQKDQAASDRAG